MLLNGATEKAARIGCPGGSSYLLRWGVLARRSAAEAWSFAMLCVLPLLCGFWGASLRRWCLLAQPCGSLRRPRRDRGIAISRLRTVRLRAQCSVRLQSRRTPVALRATYAGPPWILLYPLKRRRSAMGWEAAERGILTRRSALLQWRRWVGWCFAFCHCFAAFAAHSCAAFPGHEKA